MEFVYNQNEDGSALECYRRYMRSFPILAIVTQGWHGEILEDTFDREQDTGLFLSNCPRSKHTRINIYIRPKSGQKNNCIELKVLLITSHTAIPHVYGTVQERNEKTSLKTLSIPLEEDMLVTVVDRNLAKVGKQMQLRDVLEKHKPPIMVELTGLKTSSTKHIFMKLLSVHHLISMQGYFVNYGKVEPKQVEIPLYLSEMRLAPLTGIKGMSQTDFSKYCHNLRKGLSVETIIARNKKRVVNVYSYANVYPETNYDAMEPMAIKTLADAFEMSISLSGDGKDLLSNAPPPVVPKPAKLFKEQMTNAVGRNIHIRNRPISEIPPNNNSDSETEPENSCLSSIPDSSPRHTTVVGSHFNNHLPPALTKPPKSYRAESTLGRDRLKNMQNRPLPEIPQEVDNSVSIPKPYKSDMSAQHSRNFARAHIITEGSKHLATLSRLPEALRSAVVKPIRYNYCNDQVRSQMTARNNPHKGLPGSDLANLTVEDVTHWLRKLHLHQYIRHFKEQLIDGTLLCRLDESILFQEFNFSNTEAIRLMAFVREGHIPR